MRGNGAAINKQAFYRACCLQKASSGRRRGRAIAAPLPRCLRIAVASAEGAVRKNNDRLDMARVSSRSQQTAPGIGRNSVSLA
jgi:hypothetical protein